MYKYIIITILLLLPFISKSQSLSYGLQPTYILRGNQQVKTETSINGSMDFLMIFNYTIKVNRSTGSTKRGYSDSVINYCKDKKIFTVIIMNSSIDIRITEITSINTAFGINYTAKIINGNEIVGSLTWNKYSFHIINNKIRIDLGIKK